MHITCSELSLNPSRCKLFTHSIPVLHLTKKISLRPSVNCAPPKIIVTKPDKGKAAVLLDRSDYLISKSLWQKSPPPHKTGSQSMEIIVLIAPQDPKLN